MVATVSPSESSIAETLSTLQFAQRAKAIRNIVVCNEETSGNVLALQKEIKILREQLQALQNEPNNLIDNIPCHTPLIKLKKNYNENLNSNELIHCNNNDIITNINDSNILLHETLKNCSVMFTNSSIYGDINTNINNKSSIALQLLKRTQYLETQVIQKENIINDLQKLIDQNDKSQLCYKMKLKMRETEIQRLKKNIIPTEEELNFNNRLKIENDTIKEELNTEIIKVKLELNNNLLNKQNLYNKLIWLIENNNENDNDNNNSCNLINSLKEIVNQYNETLKETNISNQTNLQISNTAKNIISNNNNNVNYWCTSNEIKFQHDLRYNIEQIEAQQLKFINILSDVINHDFTKLCNNYTIEQISNTKNNIDNVIGLTIEEAIGLRTKNSLLLKQMTEIEYEKNKTMSAIQSFHTRATEQELLHNKLQSELKRDYELKLATNEQIILELKYKISTLTDDLETKTQNYINLQNGLEQNTNELQIFLENKEQNYRNEILQYKKDNSTLFQHFQDLKQEFIRIQLENEEYLNIKIQLNEEINELRNISEKDSEEYTISINELHDRISDLEQQIQTYMNTIQLQKNTIQQLETSLCEVNDNYRNLQLENQQMQKLCTKYQFENDNLQEDTDNLYSQQESMQEQIEEYNIIIEDYKNKVN